MIYTYLPIYKGLDKQGRPKEKYENRRILEELRKRKVDFVELKTVPEIYKTTIGPNDILLSFVSVAQDFPQFISADVSNMCKDKYLSYGVVKSNNLPCVETSIYRKNEWGFPVVLKDRFGSLGNNNWLLEQDEFADKFNEVYKGITAAVPTDLRYICQPFIAASRGKSLRVIVLGGEVLGAELLVNDDPSIYQSNAAQGSIGHRYELDGKMIALSKRIAALFGVNYCGLDFLWDGEKWVFLEINGSAHFKMFEQATGVNVAARIVDWVLKNQLVK